MIGIVGYGFVGKAVEYGFSKTDHFIVDPLHFPEHSLADLVELNPEAIFVCVPTDDGDGFATLTQTLDEIAGMDYHGVVVVKSTVLPKYLEGYNVVYNPEFLSRRTAFEDFVKPHVLVIGGQQSKAKRVLELYMNYSDVRCDNIFLTNTTTASLVKYIFNTYYATKLIFMNQMYDVVQEAGGHWGDVKQIIGKHPWVGSYHLDVPGYEGRGFSGPCLPKDTKALANEFDVDILHKVIELNEKYRDENPTS
jgi:UDPglucose 6-dehydrogenase